MLCGGGGPAKLPEVSWTFQLKLGFCDVKELSVPCGGVGGGGGGGNTHSSRTSQN